MIYRKEYKTKEKLKQGNSREYKGYKVDIKNTLTKISPFPCGLLFLFMS